MQQQQQQRRLGCSASLRAQQLQIHDMMLQTGIKLFAAHHVALQNRHSSSTEGVCLWALACSWRSQEVWVLLIAAK